MTEFSLLMFQKKNMAQRYWLTRFKTAIEQFKQKIFHYRCYIILSISIHALSYVTYKTM